LSALKLTVSAGESNPEIVRSWKQQTGSLLLDGYGQTETLMTILNYPSMKVKPGSMGKPLPGTDAVILDGNGQCVEAGTTGQLAIRSPNPQIMLGYWNDKERTDQCFIKADGKRWFITGDTANMDDEGYIFYDGRDDDMINSAGYRIGPMEVENALMEHPAVMECTVVGSPDPERGEVVKGFVLLNQNYSADSAMAEALQEHTKALTAPYKYPRKIEFVSELPKTVTGKIQRRVLKKQELKQHELLQSKLNQQGVVIQSVCAATAQTLYILTFCCCIWHKVQRVTGTVLSVFETVCNAVTITPFTVEDNIIRSTWSNASHSTCYRVVVNVGATQRLTSSPGYVVICAR